MRRRILIALVLIVAGSFVTGFGAGPGVGPLAGRGVMGFVEALAHGFDSAWGLLGLLLTVMGFAVLVATIIQVRLKGAHR